MTERRIVWKHPSGEISVSAPAPKSKKEEETEDAWIARIAERTKKAVPRLQDCERLPDCLTSDLPQSRRFRNSWRNPGDGTVKVDMPLARKQRTGEIRRERDEKFKPLDNEWMKFTGQGNKIEADKIEVKRQALRDIPNNLKLDSIKTPEALEAFEPIWP